MRKFLLFLPLSLAFLSGCGSTKEMVEIPTDMPEICKGIDFVSQPDMREVCGVRASRYQSYKNIALQRYMIVPKGAALVKTGDRVEMRLPNTLPIPLPETIGGSIEFSQDARMEYLKNRMIYKELFPPGQTRIKMFKIELPLANGSWENLCFNVPEPEIEVDERRRSRMGNRIESLNCADFENIVAKFGS